MKITLVCDNSNSWIIPYVKKLSKLLRKSNHSVAVVDHPNKIKKGDLVFLLSCEKIVKPEVLKLNKHNLVVHESALPKGKGWSPLTWQVLEGENLIPITLFEAAETVDSGLIYIQDELKFNGTELIGEMKKAQGRKTVEMVLKFVENVGEIKGAKQKGKPTYYRRRSPQDSRLDLDKPLGVQFNLLRVCDNKRYPAFFDYRGFRYIIKIYRKRIKQDEKD